MARALNLAARGAAVLGVTVYLYQKGGAYFYGVTRGSQWRGFTLVAAVQPGDAA